MNMNIVQAIKDENLFKPFLGDLKTWGRWSVALRALYGLPIRKSNSIDVVKQCTGRDAFKLPKEGFDMALFLTGRRSGKSRIAAVIGAFEACLTGREKKLAAGELGMVAIISPTTKQSRVVKSYLRSIFSTDLLAAQIVRETQESFTLSNGVQIEIMTGDWRNVRGYTLLAVIVDEICFFGLTEESKVKSDTELVRAVQPGLATTQGRLIGISSPYSERGYAYRTWKKCWGSDKATTLVWKTDSRTMNPTLPQKVIDRAYDDDPASARSEYGGEWRQDCTAYIDRSTIEKLVVQGRQELLPYYERKYIAFCDVSGGRSDDASLCIGCKGENGKIVITLLKRYKPPFDPAEIIGRMCTELQRYNIRGVHGDNYSAEFTTRAFRAHNITYWKSKLNKSQLYLEALPVLCSGEVELLDNQILVEQLTSLERRTRSGGRDIVDHPQGQHDDLANAVCGLIATAAKPRKRIGGIRMSPQRRIIYV